MSDLTKDIDTYLKHSYAFPGMGDELLRKAHNEIVRLLGRKERSKMIRYFPTMDAARECADECEQEGWAISIEEASPSGFILTVEKKTHFVFTQRDRFILQTALLYFYNHMGDGNEEFGCGDELKVGGTSGSTIHDSEIRTILNSIKV